jgi:hypothetical protein
MLKYGDANQSGLFWMRSKELDRRYILSHIRSPAMLEILQLGVEKKP